MDFTLTTLRAFLTTLQNSGYSFLRVDEFASGMTVPERKVVILRHDVDRNPAMSLDVAYLEQKLGIRGTYYFRTIPETLDESIIRQVHAMGHETGYHYEDLSLVTRSAGYSRQRFRNTGSDETKEAEMVAAAFGSFCHNLKRIREIVPVNTVCMHGSPASRYDSRLLWKYFDYQELGIIAEPYFDISLDSMLYLTDTGRRWDGSSVSVRDRMYTRDEEYYWKWVRKPATGSAMAISDIGKTLSDLNSFRSTYDIIRAAQAGKLPDHLLITLHPQRWSDHWYEWFAELVMQRVKNHVKLFINRSGLWRQ